MILDSENSTIVTPHTLLEDRPYGKIVEVRYTGQKKLLSAGIFSGVKLTPEGDVEVSLGGLSQKLRTQAHTIMVENY